MFVVFFIALVLGFDCHLHARHCIDAGCDNTPINLIKVVSERCSGSYYTETLIIKNIEGLSTTGDKFGIKHFYPWFGYESSYFGPEEDYTFEGSENVLFVILFRDPYDWLRSFKRTTFVGPAELQVCDFHTFIRSKWGINSTYKLVQEWQKIHPLIDMNPVDGSPFENVIELRTAKILNMLKIPPRVKNYYIINYEKARDYPQEVVNEVAEIFNLQLTPEFQPIKDRRGNPNAGVYVPIKYPPISREDLMHINNYLDEELENFVGYELKTEVN